jgi:hypothetical protein
MARSISSGKSLKRRIYHIVIDKASVIFCNKKSDMKCYVFSRPYIWQPTIHLIASKKKGKWLIMLNINYYLIVLELYIVKIYEPSDISNVSNLL